MNEQSFWKKKNKLQTVWGNKLIKPAYQATKKTFRQKCNKKTQYLRTRKLQFDTSARVADSFLTMVQNAFDGTNTFL